MWKHLRAFQFSAVATVCILSVGCNQNSPGPAPAAPATPSTVNRPAPIEKSGDSNLAVDRDNTATNVRDRNDSAKLPTDQNENPTDIGITADIRKQVVASDLSINAQNVKIIAQDGRVTLRGPVNSTEEKQRVEDMARSVAGSDKVDSHLEVTVE